MRTPVIADDLFAGAGGWDIAAARLGIHARGVEKMKEARATREAAGLTTIHDDVWTFWPDGRATGKIASPPCPTFSVAGKGSGRRALESVLCAIDDGAYRDLGQLREYPVSDNDERTRLVLTPLHFATQHEYEWLAWEQVPTVLPVWEACAEVLRGICWNVWTGLLYAEQYGVPQTRKRAVLLASRTREVAAPTPTHSRYYPRSPERLDPGVPSWMSMAEALGWVGDGHMVSNYGTGGDASNRGVRQFDEPAPTVTSKIDRNKAVCTGQNSEQGGGNTKPYERSTDLPAPTVTGQTRSWRVHEDDSDACHRPEWTFKRPSTTVVGTFRPEVIAAPGYRTTVSRQNAPDSVRVAVHEAGLLQSFPADFPWQGAKGRQYLQVGNAIPPGLALPVLAAAMGVSVGEVAA